MSASFPRGDHLKNSLKRIPDQNIPFAVKRARRSLSIVNNADVNKKKILDSIESTHFSDAISISNLTTGNLVLGYVLQIIKSDVLVSLPGGFTGVVSYHEISDVIYKLADGGENHLPTTDTLVQPFQMVRCYILGQVDKKDSQKKIITLSLRSSLINKGLAMKHIGVGFPISGCISSKEDHGWVVSIGITGISCFLPYKHSQNKLLVVGQPIECICSAVNDISRSITLKSHTRSLSLANTLGSLAFNSLNPGMLVSVIVDVKCQSGLLVNFLGLFKGIIDNSSLELDSKDTICVGDVLCARILLLDFANKVVRLSMRKHIVGMRPPSNLPPLGSVIENVKVVSIVHRMGILVSGDDMGQTTTDISPIFIHKTSLADVDGQNFKDFNEMRKIYVHGTKIASVRVKGYNLVEGWIIGSNMEEYIHEPVVHISDVKVGQVLDVVIFAIKDFGLVVKIGQSFSAVCPILHSVDVLVSGTNLNNKFKVGQICKMRVWEVSGSSIIMTNKKGLVDAEPHKVMKCIDDASIGKIVVGVVSKISDRDGVTVHFFNKMKGIILASILVQQKVYNFSSTFRVGQVINTVITDISKNIEGKKEIISLGLDLNINSDAVVLLSKNHVNKYKNEALEICDIEFVDGVVSRIENDNIYIALEDGRLAKTTKHHFFDSSTAANLAFSLNKIVVGHVVKRAVVISTLNGLSITCKPLLTSVASVHNKNQEYFPNKIADLSPGQIVVGFISKVESYGVLVKFRNNLTALAPRPNISDKFVNSPIGMFLIGDSVRCVVQRVDLAKERIIVTFKSSIVSPSSGNSNFLSSYFSETFFCCEKFCGPNKKNYQMGTVVSAIVSSVEEFGVVLLASDKSTLIVVRGDRHDLNKLHIGSSTNVLIVDVDYEHSVYEGILEIYQVKQNQTILKDSIVEGKIILVKEKYVVVYTTGGCLGYVQVSDYHNPRPDISGYKVDDFVKLKFLHYLLPQHLQTQFYPQEGFPLFTLLQDIALPYESTLSNSNSDSSLSIEYLAVGCCNLWTIVSINILEVRLQPEIVVSNVKILAKLHISNCVDALGGYDLCKELVSCPQPSSLKNENHPFHGFKVGDSVFCHVQHVVENKKNQEFVVTLSLATAHSDDFTGILPFRKMFSLAPNENSKVSVGVVTKIEDTCCTVALSPNAFALLNYMDVSQSDQLNDNFKRNCFIGLRIVVNVNVSSGRHFKLRASRFEIEAQLSRGLSVDQLFHSVVGNSPVTAGQTVNGFLNLRASKLPNPPAIMVCLRGNRFGRVCVTEILDRENWCDLRGLFDFNSSSVATLPNGMSHGDMVSCVVLSINDQYVELSLRHSRMSASSSSDAIKQDDIEQEGSLIKGYVVHTSSKGCFVRLSQSLTGQVLLKDISDEFISDLPSQFPPGMMVTARLLSLNLVQSQARLTIKNSKLSVKTVSTPTIGDFVSGTVKRVTDFGVFVLLPDFNIVGLARKISSHSGEINDLLEKFKIGDVVNASVLSISQDGSKIGLGLNEKRFQPLPQSVVDTTDYDLKSLKSVKSTFQLSKKADCSIESDLDINSTLLWDDFESAKLRDEICLDETESQDFPPRNIQRNGKKASESISDDKESPSCADDFERLLISQPNSSLIWTRYMAYYLNMSDIQASRSVGARALQTINFREEEEKFNVWMSLLNLEHKFGTMDSFEAVFTQAVQESKEKRIFLELAETYQRAGDIEGAEKIFQKGLKRSQLKKSKKMWTAYLQFKLRFDNIHAKEQLTRSLQCLSKHKHIEVISKYALSEFDFGSVDRGRVLFEELLNSYPKRSDLWHLYVDKEVKLENVNEARLLFERMINSKSSGRNLKLVFKKYLGFELKYGDMSCQDSVKQKAREYVDKLVN